jgi:hypothetical protein
MSEGKKNIIASLIQEHDWGMLRMNALKTPAMARRVKPFAANMVRWR